MVYQVKSLKQYKGPFTIDAESFRQALRRYREAKLKEIVRILRRRHGEMLKRLAKD